MTLGGAKCKKNAILRPDPVVRTNFWKLGQATAETDRNLQNRYGQEIENLGISGSDILVKCQGSCNCSVMAGSVNEASDVQPLRALAYLFSE